MIELGPCTRCIGACAMVAYRAGDYVPDALHPACETCEQTHCDDHGCPTTYRTHTAVELPCGCVDLTQRKVSAARTVTEYPPRRLSLCAEHAQAQRATGRPLTDRERANQIYYGDARGPRPGQMVGD